MKKSFDMPELKVVTFNVEDIITTSPGGDNYNPGEGGTPGMGM